MTLIERAGEQLFTRAPDTKLKFFAPMDTGVHKALPTRKQSDGRIGRDLIITTEHIDRDGDIIRADGIDWSTYQASNPIVLLQHGRTMQFPVVGGNAVLERTDVNGVPAWRAKEWLFADTDLGRETESLWNDGILRTASVGLGIKRALPVDAKGNRLDPENARDMARHEGSFDFTETEGREWSFVWMPANAHAHRKMAEKLASLSGRQRAYCDLGDMSTPADPPQSPEEPTTPEESDGEDVTKDAEQPAATTADGALEIEANKAKPLLTQDLGRVLKLVSIERCPSCRERVPYSRESNQLGQHRTNTGKLCAALTLDIEPTGITLKEIADTYRDRTQHEQVEKASEALNLFVVASDLRATNARAGVALREMASIMKDGRVLSAQTRQLIVSALDQIGDAGAEVRSALSMIETAAASLGEFLSDKDRREQQPDKAISSTQSTPNDDELIVALGRLVVAAAKV